MEVTSQWVGNARRWVHRGVLGLVLLTLSCTGDSATAPDTDRANTECSGSDCVSLARGSTGSMTSAQLERLLVSEKARTDRAKAASQQTYDSLKVVWQEFLDSGRRLPVSVLLRCDPLQYVAESKIIGPEGGNLDFGPHKLIIPAGALRSRTVITAEAPTSLEVTADFSPHGTQFQRSVELRLSYKHCELPRTFVPLLGVYISDAGLILEFPRTRDRRSAETVYVWPDHFSKYAVAY